MVDRFNPQGFIHPRFVVDQFARLLGPTKTSYGGWFYTKPDTDLSQGDLLVIPGVVQRDIGDSGEVATVESPYAVLLSNSCDMQPDREDFALVAPVRPILAPDEITARTGDAVPDQYRELYKSITQYENTAYCYFPKWTDVTAGYLDFGQIVSVPLALLHEVVATKADSHLASLKQEAYYLLIAKLSLYLCRPDDRWIDGAAFSAAMAPT